MSYINEHVTELESGPVVECTPATFLELVRAHFGGIQPPATAAEREALRVAMGQPDTAGANYVSAAAGCHARYGWAPTLTEGLPAEPVAGTFLGVQGFYPALPPHYRRWDPGFGVSHGNGAHSLVVYNAGAGLMICDPLAPSIVNGQPWHGESIAWPSVIAYHAGLAGAAVATATLPVTPALPEWRCTAGLVNVRSSAGVTASIVGHVHLGDTIHGTHVHGGPYKYGRQTRTDWIQMRRGAYCAAAYFRPL